MGAQEEIAQRIQDFGRDDWQPAFGMELYTEVLYVDSGGNRYYIAPLAEAQNLLDADLRARLEVTVGIVTPEPANAPDTDANEQPVEPSPSTRIESEQEATNGG